jgi:pyruvate dehydrogenase (quinone)
MQLAETLKAPTVLSLAGREWVEWDNPYDVGLTGLIGFSSGYDAMMDCSTLLMLGTDFPYRQFYPTEAKIAQIDIQAENLGRRCKLELGLVGDVRETIAAFLPRLIVKSDRSHLDRSLARYKRSREGLDELAVAGSGSRIHP